MKNYALISTLHEHFLVTAESPEEAIDKIRKKAGKMHASTEGAERRDWCYHVARWKRATPQSLPNSYRMYEYEQDELVVMDQKKEIW